MYSKGLRLGPRGLGLDSKGLGLGLDLSGLDYITASQSEKLQLIGIVPHRIMPTDNLSRGTVSRHTIVVTFTAQSPCSLQSVKKYPRFRKKRRV